MTIKILIIKIPIKINDSNNYYNERIKSNLNGLQHESPIPCQRTIGVLQNILSGVFGPELSRNVRVK